MVTGDVLFVGGCGRTDFTGGDTAQMWKSLQRLTRLPEQTRVYPGHDYGDTPTSTIAHELRTNRFLRCATFEEFRASARAQAKLIPATRRRGRLIARRRAHARAAVRISRPRPRRARREARR